MSFVRTLNIIIFQAFAHLKKECKDGFLGVLWWIVDPIIYMGAFYTIFALGLRGRGPEFAPFLLCGLIPWKWFASTVNRSTVSIKRNAQLIKQVYLPKYVFPLVEVVRNSIKFIISLIVLFVFLVFFKDGFSAHWLWVIPLSLLQLMLIISVGLFLASIHPFLPDIKIVVENFIMLLFFISGIFFDMDKFPPDIRSLFMLNPVAVMVKAYRTVLLDNNLPEAGHLLYVAGFSIMLLLPALFILKKCDRIYSKIV